MSDSKEQAVIQLCVEKLAELNGSSVRLLNSHPVGGGSINHALKIHTSIGDYFLKWNASAPVDLFLREAEGMEEMRTFDNPSLYIPKVIWSRDVNESPGLLLMEYLTPATSTSGYDERLGRGIAQLHRKTASAFGFQFSNYCGTTLQDNTWTDSWPEFYAQRRIQALVLRIIARHGMTVGEQKIYERLVGKIPQLLAHLTTPSLIHGDFLLCLAEAALRLALLILYLGYIVSYSRSMDRTDACPYHLFFNDDTFFRNDHLSSRKRTPFQN